MRLIVLSLCVIFLLLNAHVTTLGDESTHYEAAKHYVYLIHSKDDIMQIISGMKDIAFEQIQETTSKYRGIKVLRQILNKHINRMNE